MAKQVKSWEANDGSLHRDKVKAAERDVAIIVEQIMGDEFGEPMRDIVVARLILHREDIIRVLTDYHRVAPIAPKASASQNGWKGPEEGTRKPTAADHPPNCGIHRGSACDCEFSEE